MRARCEICDGRQIIRLPRRRPIAVGDVSATVEQSYGEFPCPECAPVAPLDQVRVVESNFQADTRFEGDIEYRRHLVRTGVMAIAHQIEEHGYMRIQSAPAQDRELTRTYRVTVGVVSPKIVEDMDAAREAAEERFADIVMRIAAADIDNWGSHYGHSEILKRDARHLIEGALRRAKELRPKPVGR